MNKLNFVYSAVTIILSLLLGKLLAYIMGGLPASLYGMIIFSLALHLGWFNAQKIEQSIAWIIANMGVCFVPAGVGIINHFELIKQHGFTLVAIIFFTTFILLTSVAYAYQVSDKYMNNQKITKQ